MKPKGTNSFVVWRSLDTIIIVKTIEKSKFWVFGVTLWAVIGYRYVLQNLRNDLWITVSLSIAWHKAALSPLI